MTALVQASDLALPGRLHPLSLEIEAGELVCLIGPNGSGKTSLLHAIAGIDQAAGSVGIAGLDPRRLGPAKRIRQLGFLPATREVAWPLLARDLIALGGAAPGEVAEAIERLELAGVADRRIDFLSTGERSRVLIARALAPSPTLLLLDEPTANLDPSWQLRLMHLLRADLKGAERAAIVAMHDLDLAARFADRILLIDQGRIVADGSPQQIMEEVAVGRVFGIVRVGGQWEPLSSPAGRRSSP